MKNRKICYHFNDIHYEYYSRSCAKDVVSKKKLKNISEISNLLNVTHSLQAAWVTHIIIFSLYMKVVKV